MSTTTRTTRPERDSSQLRLFAQVEAALNPTPARTPASLSPTSPPAFPSAGPAREQEGPTCQVLALALVDAAAHLALARLAFGRDQDTKARAWSALQAVRSADASVAATGEQLAVARQCGDTASAARHLVVARILVQAAAANRARLEQVSELHAARARSGPPWAQYLDTLTLQQDVIDRADAAVLIARAALLSRLAADRPGWLPVLAVDATGAARDRWDQQALQVATYRARYQVADDTHPLGARPVDLDQAGEYDRLAARARLGHPAPGHDHDQDHDRGRGRTAAYSAYVAG